MSVAGSSTSEKAPGSTPASAGRPALEARLAALRNQRARLRTDARKRDGMIDRLEKNLRATVQSTDVEEDKLTNTMLRRLDTANRTHESLQQHLTDEESSRAEMARKLESVATQNAQLKQQLRKEEDEISGRLQRQLSAVAAQKQELNSKLVVETEVAPHISEHLKRLLLSATEDLAASDRQASGLGSSVSVPTMSEVSLATSANAGDSVSLMTSGAVSPAVAPTPTQGAPSAVASLTVAPPAIAFGAVEPPAGALSVPLPGVPFAAASPTGATAASSTTPDVASRSRAMSVSARSQGSDLADDDQYVSLLAEEIDRLRGFHDELVQRGLQYQAEQSLLKGQLADAQKRAEAEAARAAAVQQALLEAETKKRDLAVTTEVIMEVSAERRLFHAPRRGSTANSETGTERSLTTRWTDADTGTATATETGAPDGDAGMLRSGSRADNRTPLGCSSIATTESSFATVRPNLGRVPAAPAAAAAATAKEASPKQAPPS